MIVSSLPSPISKRRCDPWIARKARDEEARKKAQGVVSDGPKMTKKFEEAVARRKRLEEEEIERKREQEAVILRRQEKAARVAEKMNKIVEEMERRRCVLVGS